MRSSSSRLGVAGVATLLALGAGLAGCADSPKPAQTRRPKSTPTSQRPSPVPHTPGPPHALGEKVVLADTVQAVVYEYRQPAAPAASAAATASPSAGQRTYGAADVEVCVGSRVTSTVTVSWKTWALIYPDHSIVPANSTDSADFSQPEYPFAERTVPAGRCARGWITFPVPADKRPALVEYEPHNFVADWTVPPQ